MKFNKYINCLLIILLLNGWSSLSFAQHHEGDGKATMQFTPADDSTRALLTLRRNFESAPFDKSAYNDYLKALLKGKDFSKADSVVRYMMQIRRNDPAIHIDLARVYEAAGKKKEAKESYEKALEQIPRNDFQIKALAQSFEHAGQLDYAIKTYLKGREITGNPYDYATELALLYNKKGDYKGAIDAILDKAMTQPRIKDELHAALLDIIAREKKGLKEIQRNLNNRFKIQPDFPMWQEILSWTYTQTGDYEGAFNNLVALDKELEEKGRRLISFAKNATEVGEYAIADKAYRYILNEGTDQPFYQLGLTGKIYSLFTQLEQQYPPQKKTIDELSEDFKNYFERYPQHRNSELWLLQAELEARYKNQPDTAIALLQQIIPEGLTKLNQLQGKAKLDIGDYYLLSGQIWEATLLYSQVNKAFEQDELGEQARFKNAKWAFYKGDFKLAKEQLSAIKASTSRLLANDALYLSVLITENMPTDTNSLPLQRFAAADLLLFKNKTKEADILLDSISKAWPESPLQDDIAMLRGKTAAAEGNWEKAIRFYKIVLDEYGTDVLGDDAAWHLAELYRKDVKDSERAAHYYRTLLTQYPGSTFVQEARKHFRAIQEPQKTSKKSS